MERFLSKKALEGKLFAKIITERKDEVQDTFLNDFFEALFETVSVQVQDLFRLEIMKKANHDERPIWTIQATNRFTANKEELVGLKEFIKSSTKCLSGAVLTQHYVAIHPADHYDDYAGIVAISFIMPGESIRPEDMLALRALNVNIPYLILTSYKEAIAKHYPDWMTSYLDAPVITVKTTQPELVR